MPESILYINEKEVLSLLTPAEAIAAAEDTFRHIGLGDITVGEMSLMYADEDRKNNFHSMPSILHYRNAAGVKWISTYADPAPGYPFCHGTMILLSDTRTGSPIALVEGTAITTMRTAGGHGVVQAKSLCNPNPTVLAVVGCGAQARAGVRGFLTEFSTLKEVRIYSRSRGPMEALKAEVGERAEVVICDTPAQAVEGSQILLMASGAQTPLVTWEMLKPGMTVIGIEGFRDMEVEIGRKADKWYLGYKKPDAYILRAPKLNPNGYLTEADVFGDMTELLTGKIPGRERPDEIIVSTHMGMGAHDVSCALTIYERAKAAGIGQELPIFG